MRFYISMLDACHIIPFSESYDDTVSNGIALCPTLHQAFDRGLISIDVDCRVLVSRLFIEHESSFSLKQFEGVKISLPENERYVPSKDNLRWHIENVFK